MTDKKKKEETTVVVTSHPFEGLENGEERFAKAQLTRKINSLLDGMPEAIETVDEILIIGVCGVAQAVGQLREALDKIDECLDQRQFSKASNLGYKDVASEFIFLQRVLGGLQDCQHDKDKLIQDIALETKTSYETVLPF
ncbi:MAG: hypothetical protein V3U88_09595, partial [Methylococcales bacterium]